MRRGFWFVVGSQSLYGQYMLDTVSPANAAYTYEKLRKAWAEISNSI